MANGGLTIGLPIWARVPGIILLVLAVVVGGTTLVGAAGVGGGAGPDKHAPVQRPNQEQQVGPGDGGDHRPPAGSH